MDIQINNLNNKDSIEFFKNFKDEKSKNIYKWRKKSFKFKRMEREYNCPKIIKNKKEENYKNYMEKMIKIIIFIF